MTNTEMREPTFLILTSLARGAGGDNGCEKHGYAIMQDISNMTDGRVEVRAGTLYAALVRLCGDGLIKVTREEIVDGRNRIYYGLLREGGEVLDAEVKRMRTLANTAARALSKITLL